MKENQIKSLEEMYYVAQSKDNPEEYMSLLSVHCYIKSGYTRKFKTLGEVKEYLEVSGLHDKYRPAKVYKRYEVEVEVEEE